MTYKSGDFYTDFIRELQYSITCDTLSHDNLVNMRMNTIYNRTCIAKIMTDYIKTYVAMSCIHRGNKILLDTPIGRKSLNGLIFRNKQDINNIPFSSKIIPVTIYEGSSIKDYYNKIQRIEVEVTAMQLASKAVLSGNACNLPILYGHYISNDNATDRSNIILAKNFTEDYKTIVKQRDYYTVFSELANGDLSHLFTEENAELVTNESILLQMFLALQSFHTYTQHTHNDIHFGNFLYHKITPGGFHFYKLDDLEIYVPNEGYLIVLSDFGLAEQTTDAQKIYSDFIALTMLIARFFGSKNLSVLPFETINREIFNYPNNAKILYVLLKTYKDFFTSIVFDSSKLPDNPNIINKKPYLL